MKILKALLGLSTLLVGILLVGALAMSPDYAVSRTIVIKAPADKIYPLIDSSQGWASWGVWYRKDPQMQVKNSGAAQGVGAAWSWTSESQGNGSMKLTAALPGQKVTYELQIDDFDPSQGEITLTPEGGATRVTWRMNGRMGKLVFRWFGLFMDKLVGPDFEGGLANLKQLAEKQ